MSIHRLDFSGLSAAKRADAIYRASTSEARARLWDAALGETNPASFQEARRSREPENLLNLLTPKARRFFSNTPQNPSPVAPKAPVKPAVPPMKGAPIGSPLDPNLAADLTGPAPALSGALALGPNSQHEAAIKAAADRTGIPAEALASIIDAEAGKRKDGTWNTSSRNPRSSAAGLTQFLSSTWESEAERPGTFLNNLARANNWLTEKGQVRGDARATLLSLRLDARCSIEAAADYANANVATIRKAGVKVANDPSSFARVAYLGHHLGAGDAIDYLTGGLSKDRANKLLCAQIGRERAHQRIREEGCAAAAHRAWLAEYVNRHVDPSKFVGA